MQNVVEEARLIQPERRFENCCFASIAFLRVAFLDETGYSNCEMFPARPFPVFEWARFVFRFGERSFVQLPRSRIRTVPLLPSKAIPGDALCPTKMPIVPPRPKALSENFDLRGFYRFAFIRIIRRE